MPTPSTTSTRTNPPAELDELVRSAHELLMAPTPPLPRVGRGLLKALWESRDRGRRMDALAKSVGEAIIKRAAESENAKNAAGAPAYQDAMVREPIDAFTSYGPNDVREKQDYTFADLRHFADHCPPAVAIIETRKEQVAAFAEPATVEKGRVATPGFRIRMTQRGAAPTTQDTEEIERLTQFFAEAGFTDPPEEERSPNWAPGLPHFVEQLLGDSLSLDWACIRTWESAKDPRRFPVIAFEAVDAARIRRTRMKSHGLKNGHLDMDDWMGSRPKQPDPIHFVRYDEQGDDIVEEYTAKELATWVRKPVTDVAANGYGRGELEKSIDEIKGFLEGRDYNADRFKKDNLPRGILNIIGNLGSLGMEMFRVQWKEMMEGNRWSIPTINATAEAGAGVTWTPIDLSQRDMEYGNWMHFLALWFHANFKISMDETGYSDMAQNRQPLSEASPEAKLENSKDLGLSGLMKSLAAFLNRRILWRMHPDRRYTLEFVGLGQQDALLDEQVITAQLTNGTTTLREVYKSRDQKLPDWLEKTGIPDIPAPFQQAYQIYQSTKQAKDAKDQADAAAATAADQAGKQEDTQNDQMDMAKEAHDQQMEAGDMQNEAAHKAMMAGQPGADAGAEQPGADQAADAGSGQPPVPGAGPAPAVASPMGKAGASPFPPKPGEAA